MWSPTSPNDEYIVDLHIHSKFSRACSKDLLLPNLASTAAHKGIQLMGTGDFTHPEWFRMMREELVQDSNGLYRVRDHQAPVWFVPTVEIACIYKKGDLVRRLHLVVVAPTLEVVAEINRRLGEIGNLQADGRPILGLDGKKLLQILLDISEDIMLIPAHAWTPWFAVFGSKSGFDSLEECFEELAPYVTAIETGLSSDPPMNWQLPALDNVMLVSNSDAHSLDNLGREANVMRRGDGMSYARLKGILSRNEPDGFLYTIEFYPEEGKYHLDGHAVCGVRLTPEETRRVGGKCPKCLKAVTVGVLSRIEALGQRAHSATPPAGQHPFTYIVPLREIIADVLQVGKKSKAVDRVYQQLVSQVGTEFFVLIHASLEDIAQASNRSVALAIERMRAGQLAISPGYDGVYGTVNIFTDQERVVPQQAALFE